MLLPVHLILEIVKYNGIINFSLTNKDNYIHRNYISRIKLKECGLKGNDNSFYIYLNLFNRLIIHKNKIINYSSVLIRSANNGHLYIVKLLVKNGVDIHTNEDMALRYSAEENHLEIVKFLVESGADIHACSEYALRTSAEKGHLEIVKFLVESGANKLDLALRLSSRNGHTKIVKFLVESGADIHADSDYALRYSLRYGYLEIAKFLVSKGANVSALEDSALKDMVIS